MPLALVEAVRAAGGEPATTAGPGFSTTIVLTGNGPLAPPGPRISPGP